MKNTYQNKMLTSNTKADPVPEKKADPKDRAKKRQVEVRLCQSTSKG